ncbi:DPH3 homolog [Nylanderia fulva]|uniref:DPH3 homolog n=1 Tax=Nylanderia fulva TaxID=613905 RepID=UPI0010FB44C3|nr:DPH3 homolog [Nylanderia fulva]XP_029164183.1 DPH3 homolog [Nylanderia fulva]XP_029164184.1 DPH3 homolog [Nylanderia fulva]XP_029164185.1 DPH3 homolog [Nylanderia fulva]
MPESIYYDEVEIEDFEYDEDEGIYYYPCPCGDQFQISLAELTSGEEEVTCPSCSLVIKVIYDKELFRAKQEEFEKKSGRKRIDGAKI